MKPLSEILYKAGLHEVVGSTSVDVSAVTFSSRDVTAGALFVAIRGTQVDAHQFIPQAVEAGAVAVVCEELPSEIKAGITYIKVADSQEALGQIASNFFDNPSSKLQLVGVLAHEAFD